MKKSLLIFVLSVVATVVAMAQVTTSSLSGKVTDENKEEVIGATVQVTHIPTGQVVGTITNANGRYSISGLKAGGPYNIKVSFVGYQSVIFEGVDLPLGENFVQNAWLQASETVLKDVTVTGDANINTSIARSGAGIRVSAANIETIPTVSRSMNDVMRLTPQASTHGNGFSVGGGNYRQSFVTVDGAAFNNAFGIGSNLPGNGSPISLDALDQLSVSITPFDVRQSGFIGGAINAVTKSGTNDFKGSAYIYQTNVHLKGNKVEDYELVRERNNRTTYGASVGGAIIKNKLFFFVNGEYEANVSAGPTGIARKSDSESWNPSSGNVHRPTTSQMDDMASFLKEKYNYNPGRYQGYSLETPAYRILARLDWVINQNNKINLRYSNTHSKDSNNPSSSTTPLTDSKIYPGGTDNGVQISSGKSKSGRNANAALYFESSRYYQERNFITWAAEWNSKWNEFNNVLRASYSHQDEPRSYEGGAFPTVDILQEGATLTSFGPDPFTEKNLRDVKTYTITDELTWNWKNNNILAGVQYEGNTAQNGFMQGANGYYVFSSWEDFKNGAYPAAYGITYAIDKNGNLTDFVSEMKYNQFSAYIQDQIYLTDDLKLTAGLRAETAIYPSLEDNYNSGFAKLEWRDGKKYSTDQVPGTKVTLSPRVGFNWDVLGDRSVVVRGGTGLFVGRLPMVWLVSAVGNANCGQMQYSYNTTADAKGGQVTFTPNVDEQIKQLSAEYRTYSSEHNVAPSTPTIIDKDLKMPSAWKSSLAVDAKLPGGVDFSLEGIYNREINPAIVTDEGIEESGNVTLVPNDTRIYYKNINGKHPYYITNAGNDAYYYSITASLSKKFDFGLNVNASYTFSDSKVYSDGIGDQVGSAYSTNRYSINGGNAMETGHGTFVAPHRIIASVGYSKSYAKHFASHVSLIYEGMNMGYAGGYGYSRFSYSWNKPWTGDSKTSNSLLYIPASREELNSWNFVDNGTIVDEKGNKVTYTADMQRDDFWAYINQDDYLKNRKGKYTERGGAVMPWRNSFDFKFTQDFFLNVNGKKNTLQLGVDIKNVGNLLNHDWGVYQTVKNTSLLTYTAGKGENGGNGTIMFAKDGSSRLTESYTNVTNFNSTYSIQFSLRYIFN